jgi:hypothetical protein
MKNINELFANFMGYEKVVVGYVGMPDETKWQIENEDWLAEMKIENVGTYAANVSENFIHEWDDLQYEYSWDWFMSVWDKANTKITGEEYGSSYIGLKAKIMMAICDVNLEKACKYVAELITSHLKMQK